MPRKLPHFLLMGRPGSCSNSGEARETRGIQRAALHTTQPHGVPVTSCGEGALLVGGVRYFFWSEPVC